MGISTVFGLSLLFYWKFYKYFKSSCSETIRIDHLPHTPVSENTYAIFVGFLQSCQKCILYIGAKIAGSGPHALFTFVFASIVCNSAIAAVIPVGPALYPIEIQISNILVDKLTNSKVSVSLPTEAATDSAPVETTTIVTVLETDPPTQASQGTGESSEEKKRALTLRDIELTDPYRRFSITEKHDRLYFCDSAMKWCLSDCTDTQAMVPILSDYVEYLCLSQKPDTFSLTADQSTKNAVSAASNMDIFTSDDLEISIYTHETTYNNGFENGTIAILIANSYYGLGLAYFDEERAFPETIESYLLLANEWRFKALEYEDVENKEQLIRNISQTYKDISLIPGLDPTWTKQAELLSESFAQIASAYRQ